MSKFVPQRTLDCRGDACPLPLLKTKKAMAELVRQPQRHYEALRSSLGCLLEDHRVSYLVLDEEITPDEAFSDNLGFLEEMEGQRYSNHPGNVAKYGFTYLELPRIGELLRSQDIIIPF